MTGADHQRDLARSFLEAMYRCDQRGRLVAVNEWDGGLPPRFHLLRTAEGAICRFRRDVPDALARRLEDLCNEERGPPGTWPAQYGRYLELLSSHAPVKSVGAGLVYIFAQDVAPGTPPVTIDDSNASLLRGGLDDWLPDVAHRRPFMAIIEDGRAVSICASVRISPAVHVAGVKTRAEYRRRGHAANAVAGWARAVRSLGATAVYSTSWDNIASQGVARRLGLLLIGVDFAIT
jgi:hypothetical protein